MRVYAAELISSTRVLGFQAFEFVFCIYNKLHLHVEILACDTWRRFPKTQPSEVQSVSFERE